MLLNSLRLAAGASAGVPDSLREIRERAVTHDRDHLNIKPELYEIWLESVIETARDFDDFWNESIEESWNTILGFVIQHMIKYYWAPEIRISVLIRFQK